MCLHNSVTPRTGLCKWRGRGNTGFFGMLSKTEVPISKFFSSCSPPTAVWMGLFGSGALARPDWCCPCFSVSSGGLSFPTRILRARTSPSVSQRFSKRDCLFFIYLRFRFSLPRLLTSFTVHKKKHSPKESWGWGCCWKWTRPAQGVTGP